MKKELFLILVMLGGISTAYAVEPMSLPITGQEKGDGVYGGSNLAFYDNGIAQVDVSLVYEGDDLQNYRGVGIFTMENDTKSDPIYVTEELVTGNFVLSFLNTQAGNVTGFSYELLGGDIFVSEPIVSNSTETTTNSTVIAPAQATVQEPDPVPTHSNTSLVEICFEEQTIWVPSGDLLREYLSQGATGGECPVIETPVPASITAVETPTGTNWSTYTTAELGQILAEILQELMRR